MSLKTLSNVKLSIDKSENELIKIAEKSLKKKAAVSGATLLEGSGITNASRYRTKNLPAAGAILKEEDSPEKQISFEM